MAIRKRTNKNGSISWQITVEGVRDPITGKRERFYRTVNGTKKQAHAVELEMLNQLSSGGIQKPTVTRLDHWINNWMDVYNPNIEATTRAGYREKIDNYIIPTLGHIPISNLTADTIQIWIKSLQEQELSPRTIKNAYRNLYGSLKKAVELRMIPHNPCEGIVLPKIEPYNAQVYNQAEIKAALTAAEGKDIYLLVLLGLAVGLRRGELGALKWSNIDLANGNIHIVENRVSIKGDVLTKKPKSKASYRTVAIGPTICEILKTAKAEYEELRNNYGPGFCKEAYVIHQKDGSPYHPDSITQKWDRFMTKNNLKHIRLHDLRHTCATSMIANNVDVKTVQHRMGHSSCRTTMDIYAHCTQAMDQNAANIIDSVILP